MIQRILTALVLIPLVLLLILRAPVWLLALVAGAVALLAIREFLELVKKYRVEPMYAMTYIVVILFFAVTAGGKWDQRLLYLALATTFLTSFIPFAFLTAGMRRSNLALIYPGAASGMFAFAYIAVPMALLVNIRKSPTGPFILIFLMAVVWSGDIFAYFVGKTFGRHKMSPRVSPKKTWEGAIASLAASIAFGTLFHRNTSEIYDFLHSHNLVVESRFLPAILQGGPSFWEVAALCVVLNAAAQLGDLVESAIKRGADVKDSGSILPGHGGMLDRIDALLFAAPVIWLYSLWQPFF